MADHVMATVGAPPKAAPPPPPAAETRPLATAPSAATSADVAVPPPLLHLLHRQGLRSAEEVAAPSLGASPLEPPANPEPAPPPLLPQAEALGAGAAPPASPPTSTSGAAGSVSVEPEASTRGANGAARIEAGVPLPATRPSVIPAFSFDPPLSSGDRPFVPSSSGDFPRTARAAELPAAVAAAAASFASSAASAAATAPAEVRAELVIDVEPGAPREASLDSSESGLAGTRLSGGGSGRSLAPTGTEDEPPTATDGGGVSGANPPKGPPRGAVFWGFVWWGGRPDRDRHGDGTGGGEEGDDSLLPRHRRLWRLLRAYGPARAALLQLAATVLRESLRRGLALLSRLGWGIQMVGAGLLVLSGAAHLWGRAYLNDHLIAPLTQLLTTALRRDVVLGNVRWLHPVGLFGGLPFISFGRTTIGPAEHEQTTVDITDFSLSLQPLASLLRRQAVIHITIGAPRVAITQGKNFSWLGFPMDTTPSSRVGAAIDVDALTEGLARLGSMGAARPLAAQPSAAPASPSSSPSSLPSSHEGSGASSPPPGPSQLPVFLDGISFSGGTLLLSVLEAEQPRRVENVSGLFRFGQGYHSINGEVGGAVQERPVSDVICSMPTTGMDRRHLRTVAGPPPLSPGRSKSSPGNVRVRVDISKLGRPGAIIDVCVGVRGDRLPAAALENLLELPMNIREGRVGGSLRIRLNDDASWDFPTLDGRVRCESVGFHFHDAPDDFFNADMDLVFEGRRLYLHDAKGFYGAVPCSVSGDMSIHPLTGEYRLAARVDPVELNALRETLGTRPMPYPAAGAIHGEMMITGKLDKPVYTGTAYLAPLPGAAALDATLPSVAMETVMAAAADGAVAAYDRVAFTSGTAVFTLDMDSNMMRLHSVDGTTLGGGSVSASGSIWVAPEAELDPRALKVSIRGRQLPAERVLEQYAQAANVEVPPAVLALAAGGTSLEATMEGSQLAPSLIAKWDTPEAGSSGSLDIRRAAAEFHVRGPQLDLGGKFQTAYPSFDTIRAARTQAEASAASRPVIESCDVDLGLAGLDMMAYVSPPPAKLAPTPTQPLRLKLAGRAKFDGRLTNTAAGDGMSPLPVRPSSFAGNLSLSGVKLNQLR